MNVSTPIATQGTAREGQPWPLPVFPGNVAANLEIPQKIVEAQIDVGAEFLNFVGRRLKAQSDLWHSIGRCHSPSEAADAQRKFADVVLKDYAEEAQQIFAMMQKNFQAVSTLVTQGLVTKGLASQAHSQVQSSGKASNGSGEPDKR